MKIFDFTHPDFAGHCEAKANYLKVYHNKPITEEDYIAAIQSMPKHLHWSHSHSPSHAKYEYNRLKNTYGFWSEDVEAVI